MQLEYNLRLRSGYLEITFFEFHSTFHMTWDKPIVVRVEELGLPARKEHPKTNKILDRMDPSIYVTLEQDLLALQYCVSGSPRSVRCAIRLRSYTSVTRKYEHDESRTLHQSGDSNNNFDSISERRIQQTRQCLSKLHWHLLSRLSQQLRRHKFSMLRRPTNLIMNVTHLGQRHDSNKTKTKPQSSVPVRMMCDEAQRYEYKEDVEPCAEPKIFVRLYPGGFSLCFNQRDCTLWEWATVTIGWNWIAILEERRTVSGRGGHGERESSNMTGLCFHS